MESKIYQYYATAISGLEEVVADELKSSLAGISPLRVERGKRQGRVYFSHRRSPRLLLELRTPLNICGSLFQVQGVTVGRPGLDRLLGQFQKFDLQAAQRLLKSCEPAAEEDRFQLSVTMQGAHRFSRGDLVRQVRALLQQRGVNPGEGQGLLRLHLQVEGQRALLGLQLGRSRARQCLEERGIGGPLASCLGRLLPAAGHEVLVAMGCSPAGVEELAGSGRRAQLIALDPRAAGKTGHAGWQVRGLPDFLPLQEGCADLVLAAGLGLPAHPWLAELLRILHPGGVAALLAAESRAMPAILQAFEGFAILAGLPINLKGRRHILWMMERLAGAEPLLEIEGATPGG
ncbi:MAG: hypothetical protein HYW07_19615 [Candidatus Latescibacteria bacterium]|nr:hypothetical protein [Candidatus Latescibacterota bacterium]